MHQKIIILTSLLILNLSCSQQVQKQENKEVAPKQRDWKAEVSETIKIFGHRNWIVIADAAYPELSNPAIETVVIDADQLEVVAFVSELIANANHVDANIFIDKEMDFVAEKNAKGIGAYRNALKKLLDGKPVNTLLHEDIIKKLDDSAKLFNVLNLKTDLAIPYTSVFFQLECGYWNAASEQELRTTMGGANPQ